jgi:hypothetical protein
MRKSLIKSLPVAALLVTAVFVPAACSSKAPAVPTLTIDAGISLGGSDGGPAGDASAAPLASASVAPSGSAADAGAPLGSASAAPSGSAPALLGPAVDSALDVAIAASAATAAPGMTAEGQPGRATLQTNEHFGMVVTLQPGRCYTIIAMSAPLQVSELGVVLYMLPLNLEGGRSGANDKNPAILGRGKAGATCPISPIPVPYKVDVTAKKGAGRIAVAVYSRAR